MSVTGSVYVAHMQIIQQQLGSMLLYGFVANSIVVRLASESCITTLRMLCGMCIDYGPLTQE
jgi:hypothetical protein